ncbi:unnamed protein product, partial [Phaeothamnion confervicola]
PGADTAGYRPLMRVHRFVPQTFLKPTFCDACSKLLVGFYLQGLACAVCGMAVHGECQHTMCTAEHRCRRPEQVREANRVIFLIVLPVVKEL